LETETQRQLQLLEGILQATQGTISTAESAIGDIYAFAQRINQSSMSILKTAERVSSLGGLAEQWRNSVVEFNLPDEEEQPFSSQNEHENPFGSMESVVSSGPMGVTGPTPTPTAPLRRVQRS
jgi:hypothetical protein